MKAAILGCVLLTVFAFGGKAAGALPDFIPAGSISVNPGHVIVADFNTDGATDLAVADSGNNRIAVLMGNGSGGFSAPAFFPVGESPVSLAASDLNGDGKPDVAVANETFRFIQPGIVATGTVSILFGDGKGSFSAGDPTSVGQRPLGVVISDLNRDGAPDLVTVNDFSDNISVLINAGNGRFAPAVSYGVGWHPKALLTADINRDGKPDVVTSNGEDGTVSILLGVGDGTLGDKAAFSAGPYPMSIAVSDFNGDGKQDLVVANDGTDRVNVLAGDGNGGFADPVQMSTGEFPRLVKAVDFDRDGIPDLLLVKQFNGGRGENGVYILRGAGNGAFENPVPVHVAPGGGIYMLYPETGDFNRDGKPDLAIADSFSGRLEILVARPLRGDLTADGRVDLVDAVCALQVVGGIQPAKEIFPGAGVNDNGVVGLEEALFALQQAAGVARE